MKYIPVWLAVVILFSCRSLVTTFDDIQDAVYYTDSSQESADFKDTLKVMTWNIRFGAGRIPFFGDSCGDRVLMTEDETVGYLQNIAAFIDSVKPDILLLQEVDVSSKRSAYVNQLQWLLDNTYFNNAVFGSMWEAEVIPSDGLGRVNTGNAILSRWEITDAERIKLSLRTDQWAVKKYFYLRRNILKAKMNIPGLDTALYAVNIHATAFATDDTKQKHIAKYKEVLDEIHQQEAVFVTGGDLNSIPTGALPYDFCKEDECEGESWHSDGDEAGPHKEGSYFDNFLAVGDYPRERDLLQPLYADSLIYYPAIPYQYRNSVDHFTHSTYNNTNSVIRYWDRKLDYLFTNFGNWSSTGHTHQNAFHLSDHAPVSAALIFPSP